LFCFGFVRDDDSSTMPISRNSLDPHAPVACATNRTNGVRSNPFGLKKPFAGYGDFTFALTLGIIPDPNSIPVVFYHEAIMTMQAEDKHVADGVTHHLFLLVH